MQVIAAGASAASGYWSYKSATAQRVEVVSKDCLILTEPLYLSRESQLTVEDKRKVAAVNIAREKVCTK